MCSTILSIWLCYAKNEAKHITVLFSFEKFRTEQAVDLICQPRRLEANKTLCFMWALFWREVYRSRWKVKFKIVDESHTNKTFQAAAKNAIIVTTNQ